MRISEVALTLQTWAAWAPGIEQELEWRQWLQGERRVADDRVPDVSFLPAMLRRRLSLLSKMALCAAYRCVPHAQPVRSVFASRHGDFYTTYALLNALTSGELLSPTAFSMSVHNTPSGYYSIARQDTSASTALAAGRDSLAAGFLEAATLLYSGRAAQVLLVYADEPLPSAFQIYCDEPEMPHALALLLTREPGRRVSLKLDPIHEPSAAIQPHTLSLLRLLLEGSGTAYVSGERIGWVWSWDAAA